MTDLVVEPIAKGLSGIVPAPSDKSITHRALLLAALATGESAVVFSNLGEDNLSTLAAIRALGLEATLGDKELRIHGRGLEALSAPSGPIDCGNSGTTMRLLAGILAAQRFQSVLVGDPSLTKRPMARIASPLRQRGARVEGAIDPKKPGELTPPLTIGPLPAPNVLSAIAYDSPIPSAQVKSALLLSGLYAGGSTVVSEPLVSRDHTERMLDGLGVPIRRAGAVVSLDGLAFSGVLPAFSLQVPGDLSAAAFIAVAASIVPGSEVGVRDVGTNPTRAGFVDVLKMMGGRVDVATESDQLGEPMGLLRATHAELRGTTIGGELVARSIDEIPILSALAARASGTTHIADAAELRVKESDRIAAMAGVLRAFGVEVEERRDGLVIQGRPDAPLEAAEVDSHGDHRIAMSAAILALVAKAPCRIRNVDAIATSFPRFAGTMRALGANIRAISA